MEIDIQNRTNSKLTKKSIEEKVKFFLKEYEKEADMISFTFVNDEDMEKINVKYLSHEGTTDIITFDYTEEADTVLDGEIIICIDQAKRSAREYKVKLDNEISRLIFHGLLHLCRYNDIEPEDFKMMKKREDELLEKWYGSIS